jgi:hypothetical protein
MTKQEFYKNFIVVQKTTGQGLSGIVKVLGNDADKFSLYLKELIDEGLAEMYESGNTLGDVESNRFYMPTKGYNVWKDADYDGSYQRFKSRFLTHIRFYLEALPKEHIQGEMSDRDFEQKNLFNPSMKFLSESKEFMDDYNEWLERNKESLEELKNLEEDYDKVKSLTV